MQGWQRRGRSCVLAPEEQTSCRARRRSSPPRSVRHGSRCGEAANRRVRGKQACKTKNGGPTGADTTTSREGMDTTEVGVAVGSFAMHQCLFRALEHSVKVSQLYRALQAQRAGKRLDASAVQDKQQRDDNKRLWSCYLSHLHCGITIVSCLCYWVSRPVDVYSPKYMVEGPEDSGDEKWMRHTVSFSVGYFANDLLLMLMYPQVCAHAAMPAREPTTIPK
eukprot:Tamp_09790.p1 GENE.Tamp_09790~~Tamp_09790.p1  ORF type:complete len:221 (+),score=35.70 Tamp_09790:1239-1901(+)